MTSAQRNTLHALLVALEGELSGKASRIEPNRTSTEDSGGDEDEQPLNEMLQSIASNRNRNNQGVYQRVVKALEKLKREPDSFGECEECGDEIAYGRLKAMPYAEFCVGCQSGKDQPKGGPTRRKLTDYI